MSAPRIAGFVLCSLLGAWLAAACDDRSCPASCPPPPEESCTGTDDVTYQALVCTSSGECMYPEVHTSCINRKICSANRCVDKDDDCTGCPAALRPSSCSGNTLHSFESQACYPGYCHPVSRFTDCSAQHTPPPDTCDGTLLILHAQAATCDPGGPACRYAVTTVDCAATNQVCDQATAMCKAP